jgi:hypothetical protein
LKAAFSKLRRKLPCWHRNGFAGIDAAIIIAFILVMMGVLTAFGPQILQWFAGALMGGSTGAYSLLIELPILNSTKPAQGASAGQWVGWAADSISGLLQQVALGLFSVVLIIAAMCYLLETFRIMHEGTALSIITNSVFTLILIFAVKYIYNGVAAAINAFTGWPDVGGTGLIITGGHEIDALIGAMGGGVLGGGWDVAVRFFGSVVIFIISTSILILSVMMGAVRLLLIGCLAAALPLLLMLRLIPPVKHLADSLIETVIGIMFASVIAAILIHFGFILVDQTGLGGITKLVIALATFAGAAYMSTMFAGRLGGLFMTMGGMATMASSAATGLMLGGAAMGAGGIAGGAQVLASTRGLGLSGRQTIGATLKGAGAGLATTAAAALPGALTGRQPGRVLTAAAGSMPRALQPAKELVAKRAGTTAENLLYQFGSNKAPGESAHMGLDWYENEIAGKPPKAVGEMFSQKMGLSFDAEKGGGEIQKTLASLKENPRMLDRVRLNLENFSGAPGKQKWATMKVANDNWSMYRAKMEDELGKPFYDPNLEALDMKPGFYSGILNHRTLGMTGDVAKGRTYAFMHKGFDPAKLSVERGRAYAAYLLKIGNEKGGKGDEKMGQWVADNLGINVPSKLNAKLGHDFKELIRNVNAQNPLLLDNLRINLENAEKGATPLVHTDPTNDVKALDGNTAWVATQTANPPAESELEPQAMEAPKVEAPQAPPRLVEAQKVEVPERAPLQPSVKEPMEAPSPKLMKGVGVKPAKKVRGKRWTLNEMQSLPEEKLGELLKEKHPTTDEQKGLTLDEKSVLWHKTMEALHKENKNGQA